MKSQSDPKICVLSVNSSNCSDEPSNRSAVPKTKADDPESDRHFTPGDREDDPEPDRYRMPDLQTDDPDVLAALVIRWQRCVLCGAHAEDVIHCSISGMLLGAASVSTRQPSAVTTTSSSMRIPML